MPADSGFFRMGSVSMARGGLLPALRHNKRELPERGHIDPRRTPLNYALTPQNDAQAIYRRVNVVLAENDIKPRKNAVIAIEVIFSLHTSWHERDSRPYFADCLLWLNGAIQGELLSFDVHLDEAAPHAHALILPLLDGKLQGRRIMGDVANIYRLRNEFMQQVGNRYGLRMERRLSSNARAKLAQAVRHELDQCQDPAPRSKLWALFLDHIKRDPQPFADVLGVCIDNLRKPEKSFVQIMTSKGKGSAQRIEKPP